MGILIREPFPADASALGRLHAEAWQVAYEGQLAAGYLANVTVERRTAMWERVLGVEPSVSRRVLVAEVDGTAAGFAWIGPCRDDDAPDGAGELYAINVAPRHWGEGVGAALLDAAHGALVTDGFSLAVLWVLPENTRARGFYEDRGWAADGVTRAEEDEGFVIPEVRYSRTFP